jgi:two-component system NarL family response regulator
MGRIEELVGGTAAPIEPTLRVLIADGDPLALRLLAERLAGDDVKIVGTVLDGEAAIEDALELRPDLVVMDASLPLCSGIVATERIRAQAPEVQVVILSIRDEPELVMTAIRAGAIGFLDKRIELAALSRAVRGIGRGEAAIDRRMTRLLIDEFRAAATGGKPALTTQSGGATLSARELEVLTMLSIARPTEEIAEELGLAVETVRSHVKSILRKLRVHTRSEAIALGRRRGLLNGTPLMG